MFGIDTDCQRLVDDKKGLGCWCDLGDNVQYH